VPARALIFHYFEGSGHPASQGSLTAEGFADFLTRFGRNRILPAAEWLSRARTGTLGDDDICLSFDDGLASQFDVAFPVLRDLGLTALWFPYTSSLAGATDLHEVFRYFRALRFPDLRHFYTVFDQSCAGSVYAGTVAVGLTDFVPASYLAQYTFYSDADRKFRYVRDELLGEAAYFEVMMGMMRAEGMSAADLVDRLWIRGDQLRALTDAGHVVGMHSHDHPVRMASLPPLEQKADYLTNLRMIEAATGTRPICVAYPCNCYDQETIDFLSAQGVGVGFRNLMGGQSGGFRAMECPRQDYALAAQDPW
jgi:peptidoglycan/xylan/chitin deacetylase (PgdA/CDA1 family)